MKFDQLATDEVLAKVSSNLGTNGIEVMIVESLDDAKKKVLELIPRGSEVMTMTSETLKVTGVDEAINQSKNYNPVRDRLYSMDKSTQAQEMNKLGAAPEYAVGSVHAVTQNGEVLIASNTGSQLGAYVYGALNVIWVVGAQKIVANLEEGMQRIYKYVLPLESERAHKAYGVAGSNVSKILIINKEVSSGRLKMVIVKEKVGF